MGKPLMVFGLMLVLIGMACADGSSLVVVLTLMGFGAVAAYAGYLRAEMN